MSTLTENGVTGDVREEEDLPKLTLFWKDKSFPSRKKENIPVYEGDDELKDIILRRFNLSSTRSALYYFNARHVSQCVVVALSEESVLNWLADFGVLDGMKLSDDEVKEKIEEHGHVPDAIPLGNASEYFQIESYTLEEVPLSKVKHFNSQITFNEGGFMHIWENNSLNDEPPIHDFFVRLNNLVNPEIEFGIDNYWVPDSNRTPSKDYMNKRVCREVWKLIKDNR